MKRLYFALACACCLNIPALLAQTQLTGAIISKHGNDCDHAHPIAHAFDGDINTYYNSCANRAANDWIGFDLGSRHVITAIAFSGRNDSKPAEYASRLQLGIFEGANEPDFGDALPLFIVPAAAAAGQLTTQDVACTRGFRYVRFVFRNNNNGLSNYISELQFFGHEGEGDDSQLPQLTNLPTVSIHTVNAEDIVEKEKYIRGIVSVVYDGGRKAYTDSLNIRGRGNNSWTHPKKPYRMKLDHSVKLMGLPAKAKNWTLINNYGDKTLMRNILAFDFSRRLEMPYTSPAEAVDVVLNGDYKGTYQLCDHIDVRKGRVDIEEMTADDLTGGYMLEIDAYANLEEKWFTYQPYDIPVTIKYPDEDDITPAQEKYIADYFAKLMDAVRADNYRDVQNGYRRYMDLSTFLRHFLTGEYTGNTDTYWSVRMTKKRDDEQFFFGPVWDFDIAFDNDNRTYPINNKTDYVCFDGGSNAGGTINFVRRIFSDPAAVAQLEDTYAHYRDRGVITAEKLTAQVDSCAALLARSQDLNFKRWDIMNQLVHQNPVVHGSYEKEVANVRRYVRERIEWLDRKLHYTPSPVSHVGQIADNGIEATLTVQPGTLGIDLPADRTLRVFSLTGNLMLQSSLTAGQHTVGLANGLYLVTLTGNDGTAQSYKCAIP